MKLASAAIAELLPRAAAAWLSKILHRLSQLGLIEWRML